MSAITEETTNSTFPLYLNNKRITMCVAYPISLGERITAIEDKVRYEEAEHGFNMNDVSDIIERFVSNFNRLPIKGEVLKITTTYYKVVEHPGYDIDWQTTKVLLRLDEAPFPLGFNYNL
jgi:hypothetical protein